MFEGEDILRVARKHEGEAYILGARAPMTNSNWGGPWDCAELATWCTYQTYQIVFGCKPHDPMKGDAYTGFWYDDAVRADAMCSIDEALETPGAFLLRKPGDHRIKIGHIAISCGDGSSFEAKGRNSGVGPFPGAASRPWSCGVKLPGVLYKRGSGAISHSPSTNLLMIKNPYMRGGAVIELQKALKEQGAHPGNIDGVFGPLTEMGVIAFQMQEGLTVDGVVGQETRKALGI